jgi:hypothetical protein
MPPKLGMLELAKAVRNRPISRENVFDVPLARRHELIDAFKSIVVPTSAGIEFIASVQDMLYQGLTRRNPLTEANRRSIHENSELKGSPEKTIPWFPSFASGAILEAITGMGKSQILDRYLSLLPIVIEHGPLPECQWAKLKQLVYLKVHMPSDGSRGGFLESAFLALDESLGSNYRQQYKRWTIERKTVVFLHLLSIHRCGLLVVEEAQERNLAHTMFAREFQTFFLRLLNWGIPTVVLGNPLAFSELRRFSQDADRFSEGGWHTMLPVNDPTDSEWVNHWIPGLWKPTLLDEPDAPYSPLPDGNAEPTLEHFIWSRTAGVPRYLCRLRREVQKRALFTQKAIDTEMIDFVYRNSKTFASIRPRIEAMVAKDWKRLQVFSDIPSDTFRRLWNRDADTESNFPDTAGGKAEQSGQKASKSKQSTRNKKGLLNTSPLPPLDENFQEAQIRSLTLAAKQVDA